MHRLIEAQERLGVSGLMRNSAREFARTYNRRKERMNAYWGDNFHATLVEGGRYLWSCLCYVELNMVRCGVVGHPREWEWVGYHEIMGGRRRYCLLDVERLCWRLGTGDLEEVRRHLEAALAEAIARGMLEREAIWTESLAIGSAAFVEQIEPLVSSRRETEIIERPEGLAVLREAPVPYGQKRDSKNGANLHSAACGGVIMSILALPFQDGLQNCASVISRSERTSRCVWVSWSWYSSVGRSFAVMA